MSTAVAEQPAIDTNQVETEPWCEKPFPAGRVFRVFIADKAYQDMWRHARETLVQGDLIAEVGGILIGDIFRDDSGPYLEINAAIVAEHTRSENTEVAFTPETWAQVNRVKDSLYPDRRMVGWYHTHPRFGIFLSERDKFIHRHSFPQPWAAAFVIDPVQDLEGLFLWNNGEPRAAPEYWAGGERKLHSPGESVEEEPPDLEKQQMPIGSRTTYLLSLSLMLATLLVAGGLYYRNEMRRAQEIGLIVRGLNSQQQEIDRAQQNVVLLQQYLSSTSQDNAAQKDQVNNSIKQLESGLLLVKTLTRRMQSRIDALENKDTTDANQQSPSEAGSESERKP